MERITEKRVSTESQLWRKQFSGPSGALPLSYPRHNESSRYIPAITRVVERKGFFLVTRIVTRKVVFCCCCFFDKNSCEERILSRDKNSGEERILSSDENGGKESILSPDDNRGEEKKSLWARKNSLPLGDKFAPSCSGYCGVGVLMAHSLCIHRFYWTVRLRPVPDMIMASFSITFDVAIASCVPDENDGNRTDCHAAI